jgi:hypothetical protein
LDINITDYIYEYVNSDQFALESPLPDEQNMMPPEMLLGFMFADFEGMIINAESIEDVLLVAGGRKELSFEVKKALPSLFEGFFKYIASSGKYPPAKNWLNDLQLAAPRYLSKLREDGTLKGETFRKNYTDAGRNDPCPCGSGKKFKKCCMGLLG